MRICHLGKYYPPAPGGIESHVRTLARAQARFGGADVEVICGNHRDSDGNDVTHLPLLETPLRHERDGAVRVTRAGRVLSCSRWDVCPSLRQIMRRLQRDPPDVLHLHTPNPTMLLAIQCHLRRDIPLVISHHSDIIRQGRLLRELHGVFEASLYARADALLCSSDQFGQSSGVLRRFNDKVQTLPFGIDHGPYLHPTPAALAHAHTLRQRFGAIIWLLVGRCVYYKGMHIAVEALRKVQGVLLLVGSGELKSDLQTYAQQIGVHDRIIWRQNLSQDELIGAYLAATALWFPSNQRSEAFGLVQVEAMAAGCPVINTDLHGSGVRWVSPNRQSGLTIPVNDARALGHAARTIILDEGLRRSLSLGAIQRARRLFDHRTMAEKSLALYGQILSARRAHRWASVAINGARD